MFKSLFGIKPPDTQVNQAGTTQDKVDSGSGFSRLTSALSLTGKSLIQRVVSVGHTDETPLDEDDFDRIEETLIRADVGVDMAVDITEKIRRDKSIRSQANLRAFLKQSFSNVLEEGMPSTQLVLHPGKLNIIMVVGVNGAGKTTLIGKLAHRYGQQKLKVVIAAGDTFRAAAEDQLQVWAERAQAHLVRKDNGDPAAVIFDALQYAKSQQMDVLIVDTAGRLQNKFNLMEELSKINKIIDRESPPDAHRECLLVIDATTGQNALRQAEVFQQSASLTGVALTKLDGSAKGGIVFNIAQTYRLPIKLIGVGEKIEDLRDFKSHEFIDALFGEPGDV